MRSAKTKDWAVVSAGSPVRKEEILKTDKDGFAIIKLKIKDSIYLIEAGSGTQLMFLEDAKRQVVVLDLGTGDVKVDASGAVKGTKLEVKTPALLIDVKGGSVYASVYGSESRYKKWYTPGVYLTEVQVIEGRVAVANYNDKGPDYENSTLLAAGYKAEVKGKVK